MPCSYIEGKVPKLSVLDVLRNIPRFSCDQKYVLQKEIRSVDSLINLNHNTKLTHVQLWGAEKRQSAENLPYSSRNFSSYLTECGNLEKF